MDIEEIRSSNLKRLIDERWGGVRAHLARAMDRPPNFLSRYFLATPSRLPVSSKLARKAEALTRTRVCPAPWPAIPDGWIDDINNASPRSSVPFVGDERAAGLLRAAKMPNRDTHDKYVQIPDDVGGPRCFVVTMTDDAMLSARGRINIPSGYQLVIDRDRAVVSGAICAVARRSKPGILIRRVINEVDGSRQLRPLNPRYKTLHVTTKQIGGIAPVTFVFTSF